MLGEGESVNQVAKRSSYNATSVWVPSCIDCSNPVGLVQGLKWHYRGARFASQHWNLVLQPGVDIRLCTHESGFEILDRNLVPPFCQDSEARFRSFNRVLVT